MGLGEFFKKVFIGEKEDEAELMRLRARHGITADEKGDSQDKAPEDREAYDPWEEIKNYKTNFLLGGWVSRKFRVVGEDKLKKQLAELEKKREEERKRRGDN